MLVKKKREKEGTEEKLVVLSTLMIMSVWNHFALVARTGQLSQLRVYDLTSEAGRLDGLLR